MTQRRERGGQEERERKRGEEREVHEMDEREGSRCGQSEVQLGNADSLVEECWIEHVGFIAWTAGRKAPAWGKGSELGISSPITHCALWSSFSLVCEVGFTTAPMMPSELGAWSEKREGRAPQSAWHW